jgi:uncharacterized phage protein (TIGR02218 family)
VRTGVSSAFWLRLQQDVVDIVELIDLTTTGVAFHWTSANDTLFAPFSGTNVPYDPFPGRTAEGIQESTDLAVGVVDFVIANTGSVFGAIMLSSDIDMAEIVVRRCFASSPGLGQMEVFRGRLGDYAYNRAEITGQARDQWDGLAANFPPYTYQDNCVWRFGGSGCGINTSSFTITFPSSAVQVSSSTKLNILLGSGYLAGSYSNGRFDFGRLTWTVGQNSGQVRTIRGHSGDLLYMSHALPFSPASGDRASIYPGCRKRYEADCSSIYNNSSAFLGFKWIPIQEDAF